MSHVSEKDIQGEGMTNEAGRGDSFPLGHALFFSIFFSFIPSPTYLFVFSFLLDSSSWKSRFSSDQSVLS